MKKSYSVRNLQFIKFKGRTILGSIFNSLPFDVWFKDIEGKYVYINDNFLTYTKMNRDEIIGKNDYEIYPEEEAAIYVESDQATLAGQTPGHYESEYKPGRFKEEYKTPIFNEKGEVIGTTGFSKDITDRVQLNMDLVKSERRFRAIFEEAPMGIGVFDSITEQALQVNAKFTDIIGRSLEEINTMSWQKYSHPDEIEENLNMMDLMNIGHISGFTMEKRFIREDGSFVWVSMTIAPVNERDSISPQHLCMIEDITVRKEREQQIDYLTFHDVLTGLSNRAFYDAEKKRLDTARQLPISIIMGDINGLKLSNDMFGHSSGDSLLIEVSSILKQSCRSEDIVARIGGDEFAILLPQTTYESARQIKNRIYELCKESENSKNTELLFPSISLGCSTKVTIKQQIDDIEKEAEEAMYRRKLLERKSMHSSLIASIKATMREKSHETVEHAERLISLSRKMGEALGLIDEELNKLMLLATLHDIGKMNISDAILYKPSALTLEEWKEMKRHPEIGYRIAQATPELQPIADSILYHHERWDGTGYPQGFMKDTIPLLSRIISVVDAYDAMTGKRPYRNSLSHSEALDEIRNNAGTQFDPAIASIFLELFSDFSNVL